VATNPLKTKAMKQWPLPQNFIELRGFLCLTGYYRKFVECYGILARPLTNMLHHKKFSWIDDARQAFDSLKIAITTTPVLTFPDFSKEFTVETDACDSGIGVVLSQDGHPIAYFSKGLSVANQRLSTYEKEFMAVLMAVDKWRSYLHRYPSIIKTGHQSLCHLQDQTLSTDLQRKAMRKLAGLQFKFVYKKGCDNKVVDALSRVGTHLTQNVISVVLPVWIHEVINSYHNDDEAAHLLQELAVCSPNSQGYYLFDGIIKFQNKVWIGNNSTLQTKLINSFHASALGGYSGIQATHNRLKKLFFWENMRQDVDSFVKQCSICQQAKHELCKYPRLPQPLPVPKQFWTDLSMDFIDGLPLSAGYSMILVVVDRFTKYSHFFPLKHPYSATSVAQVFLGIPQSIISDRDRVFLSVFWTELFKLLKTDLKISSIYHP
jgi:hypothetical protein